MAEARAASVPAQGSDGAAGTRPYRARLYRRERRPSPRAGVSSHAGDDLRAIGDIMIPKLPRPLTEIDITGRIARQRRVEFDS